MSKTSSILMWVAAVLFAGVYFFPLWTIDLRAPQYPDGLGINIWVSKITGRQPHDLTHCVQNGLVAIRPFTARVVQLPLQTLDHLVQLLDSGHRMELEQIKFIGAQKFK